MNGTTRSINTMSLVGIHPLLDVPMSPSFNLLPWWRTIHRDPPGDRALPGNRRHDFGRRWTVSVICVTLRLEYGGNDVIPVVWMEIDLAASSGD
jgi:hypothetical protein